MSFKEDECYSRREIHEKLGGGIQDYLPHINGRVVCGAFRTDTNPKAPEEILVGNGPNIMKYGKILCEQSGSIPVFIKKASNRWEYRGEYSADRWTEDNAVIAEKSEESGRNNITKVICLKKIRK